MEIKHLKESPRGAFYVGTPDDRQAEMTYIFTGKEKFIIDHTEVSDSLRGQGIGKQLVQAAVDYARENSLKILPLCPFAKAVFKRHKEFSDVLF